MNSVHHGVFCVACLPAISLIQQLEAKLEVERKEHQLKAVHLESLKELGVDMTRYLIALQPQFGPEKEVIVGGPTTTVRALRPSIV